MADDPVPTAGFNDAANGPAAGIDALTVDSNGPVSRSRRPLRSLEPDLPAPILNQTQRDNTKLLVSRNSPNIFRVLRLTHVDSIDKLIRLCADRWHTRHQQVERVFVEFPEVGVGVVIELLRGDEGDDEELRQAVKRAWQLTDDNVVYIYARIIEYGHR